MADILAIMADIPAQMADIPAIMADIPALMADLNARRWADLLSQIPHSPILNPGEYGDSGPSSSTQWAFLNVSVHLDPVGHRYLVA